MRRRSALAAAALLLAVGLSGCGDTSDSTDPEDETACGADDGDTVTVEIGDFMFDPTPVPVERCDTVAWTNMHDQAHTSTGNGDQTWTTGNVAPGATSEAVRFEEAGSFTYLCALHPFMEGAVEVA